MSSYNNKPGSSRFLLPFYLGYSYFRYSVSPEGAQRFLLSNCVSRTGKNLDPLPPNFVCSLRRPRSRWRSSLAPCASTSATAARGDTTTCTSWTRTSQAGRGSRAEARPATEENSSSNSSSSSFPAPAPLGPPGPRSYASSRRKTSDMSRVVFPISAFLGRRHVLASCCCCSCMIFSPFASWEQGFGACLNKEMWRKRHCFSSGRYSLASSACLEREYFSSRKSIPIHRLLPGLVQVGALASSMNRSNRRRVKKPYRIKHHQQQFLFCWFHWKGLKGQSPPTFLIAKFNP